MADWEHPQTEETPPFWETWSANFPLHVTVEAEEAGIPAGVSFDRAGKSVFATVGELTQALRSLGYAIAPPDEFAPAEMYSPVKYLDPEPWVDRTFGTRAWTRLSVHSEFKPRDGYSQNREDY